MRRDTGVAAPAAGWPAAAAPADYVLGNVRAVLPGAILDNARVVVRDGLIVEVGTAPVGTAPVGTAPAGSPAAGAGPDVDGGGLFCLPGLIDVHSDALEKERVPRPSVHLPWDFAVASFEGKLRAAGITTAFHGAGFQEKDASGAVRRSARAARDLCDAVTARAAAGTTGPGTAGPGTMMAPLVDHRVLFRLDARSETGAAALADVLAAHPAASGAALVSHEDHTPGQGQYTDRRYMERYVAGTHGLSEEEAVRHVDELIARREQDLPVLTRNMAWLGELARAGRIRLVGHDPDSPAAIDALRDRGGSVAEFPTTVEAARRARDLGFPVVMGAPNIMRGESHSGNVSARELVRQGLVTALASDYLPSGLLAAAFALASDGLVPLPAAVSLVTAGAAEASGLTDRGRLEPGLRADLVLVDASGAWPAARAVFRAA